MPDNTVPTFSFTVLDPALKEAHSVPRIKGLVWAIEAVPGKGITPLEADEVQRILQSPAVEDPENDVLLEANSWCWLHFDTVHRSARSHVGRLPGMPEDVGMMLAETDYGIALEAADDTVWGALPAFDDALAEEDREICAWRFAMRQNLLITTRRTPIPVLGSAYRSLQTQGVPRNPAGVIDRVLRDFTGTVRRQLGQLDDELDRAEDVLLAIEHGSDLGHLGGIVGKVRRRATELRRVVMPIDRVLRDEDLDLPDWAEDDLRDRAERQIHAALDDLIALQDRARSLQDELASSQAEETNRRLCIVSIVTTLMLPATLVTGFFGMNTGGMFLASGGLGTIFAGGLCVAAMIVTFIFMKMARLF
ncbi:MULTISPECIES: CorA family divalent cation transporter [Bombella]|uniref:Magnesium transporter n=1 Tax=Bombella pollinis TaxID=2967337 RepID=A0ABT3WN16_9PROT|nr:MULTISPECIES: CorA family divalent cation transporter [Bombella]MCT6854938.1 magnesium transporter [Bombella apis]MCX5619142.1 magnesium transporter [Bombella pollinis]MUG89335.1 magnesium transporter [Bombella sp. ESL0385]